MERRKIVDYVVIKANGFNDDINKLIRDEIRFNNLFNEHSEKIEDLERKTIRLQKSFDVFQELLKLEDGKEYPVLETSTDIEFAEDHPLMNVSIVDQKKVGLIKHDEINQIILNIKEALEISNKSLNSNKKTKSMYLRKIKESKNIRTSFEKKVLDLLNNGYELVGGAQIKYESGFQTLIKYEGSDKGLD